MKQELSKTHCHLQCKLLPGVNYLVHHNITCIQSEAVMVAVVHYTTFGKSPISLKIYLMRQLVSVCCFGWSVPENILYELCLYN